MDHSLREIIVNVSRRLAVATARSGTREDGILCRLSLDKWFWEILFPAIETQIEGVDPTPRDEVAVLALMALLGPARGGVPPAEQLDELLGHVAKYATDKTEEDRMEWIVQLALAYGAGWGRSTPCDSRFWGAPWEGAIQEFVEIAFRQIGKTHRLLADNIAGFRQVVWSPQNTKVIRSDALEIVMLFVSRPVEPDAPKYREFQSLQYWDPALGNLYGWLKGAIQGSQNRGVEAGFFRNGLLYEVFCRRGPEPGLDLVEVSKVAVQVCPDHPDDKHEWNGRGCPVCDGPQIVTFKVVLVVPDKLYCHNYFWSCPDSEPPHYFDKNLLRCPKCGKLHGKKATTLLVKREFLPGQTVPKEVSEEDTTDA